MMELPPRTRRQLFRALAAAGAIAASGTPLTGCGAAGNRLSSASASGHPGDLIMIIRHGEKPKGSSSTDGHDADGTPDKHALTTRGWSRAQALVRLFAPTTGPLRAGLVRPAAIYAAGGSSGEGLRTRQTVTPLAEHLNLSIDTQFTKGDETSLAREAAGRTEPTLICWQHGELPAIVAALAGVTPTPPTSWPGDRYDMVWVLAPAAGGWSFHQIPELLLDGDSNQPVTDHN
jgi:hypothetical protein